MKQFAAYNNIQYCFVCDSLELHRNMAMKRLDSSSSPPALAAPSLNSPSSATPCVQLSQQLPLPSAANGVSFGHHLPPPSGPAVRRAVAATGGPPSLNPSMISHSAAIGFSPASATAPPFGQHPQLASLPYGAAGSLQYGSPMTYAIQMMQPTVVPVFNYGSGYLDAAAAAQCNLATKIKGGLTLAAATSVGRNGYKYSPY